MVHIWQPSILCWCMMTRSSRWCHYLFTWCIWITEDSCGNYHSWDKWIFQWFYYLQNKFSYAGTFILNQGSGILAAYDTLMMYWKWHVDGSLQDCGISWALAMEILQSCTKPSMSYGCFVGMQIGCVITSLWYIINRKCLIWTLKYFWNFLRIIYPTFCNTYHLLSYIACICQMRMFPALVLIYIACLAVTWQIYDHMAGQRLLQKTQNFSGMFCLWADVKSASTNGKVE